MAGKKVSFTQLTHDVVNSSPEPLSFAEILHKVNSITPITTKNPKSTIRNAISQSRMIVSTGDGRYGWKPRLINGSLVRHTIQEAELVQNRLYWDRDVWDALWPTFSASKRYDDRSPVLDVEIIAVNMPSVRITFEGSIVDSLELFRVFGTRFSIVHFGNVPA